MAAINHPLGRGRTHGGTRLGLPARNPLERVNWWVLGALALLGVSATLPVVQNSSATSRGFEVQQLRAEQDLLEGAVSVLESDIAELTSLDRVQRRASELGLQPATSTIYISVDEAGPEPAKIPAEYLSDPAPTTGGTEPWWQSLLEWLPLLPD